MALKNNRVNVNDGGSSGNGRGAAGYKMPTNPELRRNTRQATPIATKQSHPIATKQATPRDNRADNMRSEYEAFRKQAKKR